MIILSGFVSEIIVKLFIVFIITWTITLVVFCLLAFKFYRDYYKKEEILKEYESEVDSFLLQLGEAYKQEMAAKIAHTSIENLRQIGCSIPGYDLSWYCAVEKAAYEVLSNN